VSWFRACAHVCEGWVAGLPRFLGCIRYSLACGGGLNNTLAGACGGGVNGSVAGACGWALNEVIALVVFFGLSDGEAVAEAVVGAVAAGEEFGGEAEGHLEGVGAVVVVGDGEFLELVE